MARAQQVTSKRKMSGKLDSVDDSTRLKAAMKLNAAYEGLNFCAAQRRALNSEISDLIPDVLDVGKKLYESAMAQYESGNFQKAAQIASSLSDLTTLIEGVSRHDIRDQLRMSPPPKMPRVSQSRDSHSKDIHPALVTLAALIKQKLKMSSRLYRAQIVDYQKVLEEVSKCYQKYMPTH